MPDTPRWLSTAEFAQTAAISLQAARRALRDSLRGRPWRDQDLNVRHVLVAGGRGGLGYEVEAASLPRELTLGASPAAQPSPTKDRSTARGQNDTVLKRLAAITPGPLSTADLRRAREMALTERLEQAQGPHD